MSDMVVVSAALTGALTRREHCAAIPYTPVEIAEEARRAAAGSSAASSCLLKMMLTAPSGPITEISARGQATSRSGW